VISEATRAPEQLIGYVIRRPTPPGEDAPPADVPSTLKRLTAQTGLTFTEATRRVPVLRIQAVD
jgi:hypothetical protein